MNTPFKNLQRTPRIQLSEESYNMGMNYTNNPLLEGFSKYLVNFNLKDNGNILIPRNGLRTTTLIKYATDQTPPVFNNGMLPEISLNNSIILTDYANKTGYEVTVNDVVSDVVNNIDIKEADIIELTNNELFFNTTEAAEIHNIQLDANAPVSKHIGAYAFNNNYYYFRNEHIEDEEYENQLVYTNKGTPTVVTPRALTPKDAVTWGYNMLSDNPYSFANSSGGGTIQLLGMSPYASADTNADIVPTPLINQTVCLKAYYIGNTFNTYKFVWEWKEPGSATWISLKEETLVLTGLPVLTCWFSSPVANAMIRLTATKSGDTVSEQVLTVGFSFNKEDYKDNVNSKAVKYSLHTAAGMSYWKNRLLVYGVDSDKTILFMSEVNDPSYFPYPNNVEVFDEDIIHATPFLDSLLVFTTTKLYMLTLTPDGLSWTKKCIQTNLNIKQWDLHLIQPVKNMVFFKSGNYYYMVVPQRSSMTGDLVIAPISKNIENLLDNFKDVVDEIVEIVYNYKEGLTLLHYYNFLDYEDIHNVYTFKTINYTYINFVLLYNTVARNWRIHIHESQQILKPFKQDATQTGVQMSVSPCDVGEYTLPYIQLLQYSKTEVSDWYIPNNQVYDNLDDLTPDITFKNYQMIDTGYREHTTDLKKRFREMQFKINNISQQSLDFFSEFHIDGGLRKGMYNYSTKHNPDTYEVYVQREYIDPVILPGTTSLNHWTLDVSPFPDIFFWKVRIPVSGKGYSPRFVLISFNELPFELLNISWVFRQMNGR